MVNKWQECEHQILIGNPCHDCMDEGAKRQRIFKHLEKIGSAMESWLNSETDSEADRCFVENLAGFVDNLKQIVKP